MTDKKVYYDFNDVDGRLYECVTDCPYKKRIDRYKSIIKVGSTECETCEYFVDNRHSEGYVICKAEKNDLC